VATEKGTAPPTDSRASAAPALLASYWTEFLTTALVAAALVLGVMHFSGTLRTGASASVAVVTFDVVKYTNATRAVASSFLKNDAQGASADSGTLLLNLSERTRETIAYIAGPGTLVMVKQGVVQGQAADITDEVLKALGLPTNVPTQDNAAYALDVAPTMLHLMPPPPARAPAPVVSGPNVLP
jgi:hypothetical protein